MSILGLDRKSDILSMAEQLKGRSPFPFETIAVAVNFSPRYSSVINEAARIAYLHKSKLILKKEDANKIIFVEDRHYESDFIFTNYYYFNNPIYNKKRYTIPDNFKSYYKLKINGNVINELFINTKLTK